MTAHSQVRDAAAEIASDLIDIADNISPTRGVYPAPELRKIAKRIEAMPLPADPPQLPDGLMKDMAKALERARPFVESARITATLRSVEDLGERERPLTMLMSQIDAVLDRYHATKDLPDAR